MYNLREVAPGLHVGSYLGVMLRSDWSLVIDYDGVSQEDDNASFYPPNTLQVLRFDDGRLFPQGHLNRTLELFDQILTPALGRPVLLHCAMGLSRSPSAAYALLRVRYGLDHGKALRRIRVQGNLGYPLERTLAGAVAWAEEQLRQTAQ